MTTLTALRQEAADALTAVGITASAYIPGRFVPPIAVVAPGSPYIETGGTYCQHTVNLSILLVSQTATNETSSEALDEQIAQALVALEDAGFDLTEVSQPGAFNANNADYLSAFLNITKNIEIGDS